VELVQVLFENFKNLFWSAKVGSLMKTNK